MLPTDRLRIPRPTVSGTGRGGPLASRNFRLFLLSQSVAGTGTWVQRTAQDWLVLQLTGSVTAVGVIVTVQCLPAIVLGLWGGATADRYPKRRLMVACNVTSALLALTLGVLTLVHAAGMGTVCAVAAVLGIVSAVEGPARQAFIPQLVAPGARRSATGLTAAGYQLSRTVGPAVAGIMITCVGSGWTFLLCVMATVLCATCLLLLRTRHLDESPAARAPRPAARGSEALAFVAARPELLWTLVLSGLMGLLGFNFAVLLPAFVSASFGAHPRSFGLFSTLLAAGSLAGALLAARLRTCPLRTLALAALALGVLQAAVAFSPSEAGFGLLLVPIGTSALCFSTTASTTLQLGARKDLQGRVAGLNMLVLLGGAAAGGPLAGVLTHAAGPAGAFGVVGACCVALAVPAAVAAARVRAGDRARVPARTAPVPATAPAVLAEA
ncbi:MFS transporter [Streptomyces wuyuanensis]|uniref:MFS transporter n=1 Tax=Streptomyces wuyuanensis TaxID=1196353 RepID=UPI0034458051